MAGRQIKPSKGNLESYDAGRRHVFAEKIQPLPEDLKKKISVVLEAVPKRSKNEIAEVLQSCDYDVAKALNCFVAEGEMEVQNEWMVQGSRKNKKKKKSGKKTPKEIVENQADATPSQSTDLQKEQTSPVSHLDIEEAKESEKETTESTTESTPAHTPSNIIQEANGKLPQGTTGKMTAIKEDTTKNPVKPLENGTLDSDETNVSEGLPASPLLPTESVKSIEVKSIEVKSSLDSHGKDKPAEGQSRVRTHSTSGPEVIRKSLKDLQRSSVSIARFQSMFDAQADSSIKILAKTFQTLRQSLDEREKLLEKQLEDVILETRKLLQERQEDAADLKFKCNRVGSMTDYETTELRSEIKHFVGERRIDEDLGKTLRFLRNEEKMIETIKSFGEVTPIKHHYTSYKRKPLEPTTTKPTPSKPAALKTTPLKTTPLKTTPLKTTKPPASGVQASGVQASGKHEAPSETKGSNPRSNKHPVLSPSLLKDQAEMHTRLQEAVKKQQVGPIAKNGKKEEHVADVEKQKLKDFGGKTSKFQSGKQPTREPHRQQQTSPQNRQVNPRNSAQNFPKSQHKYEERNGGGEVNKKLTLDEKPAGDSASSARDVMSEDKEQIPSDHVTDHQPANKRTKRRYVRRTPLEKTNGGANDVFRGRSTPDKNVPDKNAPDKSAKDEKPSKETDNKQESTNGDGAVIQGRTENSVVNGVAALPQRNTKARRMYYKKDPKSEVKFPPPRENGSLSNGASMPQSSVA